MLNGSIATAECTLPLSLYAAPAVGRKTGRGRLAFVRADGEQIDHEAAAGVADGGANVAGQRIADHDCGIDDRFTVGIEHRSFDRRHVRGRRLRARRHGREQRDRSQEESSDQTDPPSRVLTGLRHRRPPRALESSAAVATIVTRRAGLVTSV
jgi:hypothetical protein